MSADIAVQLELSDSQALALAQLVKRIGWAEMRQNATSDAEAYEMRDALASLQKTLANAGFAGNSGFLAGFAQCLDRQYRRRRFNLYRIISAYYTNFIFLSPFRGWGNFKKFAIWKQQKHYNIQPKILKATSTCAGAPAVATTLC